MIYALTAMTIITGNINIVLLEEHEGTQEYKNKLNLLDFFAYINDVSKKP